MFGLQVINEIEAMQRQMDQLFSGISRERVRENVQLSVAEGDKEYRVEALLPGLDAKKLDISILGRKLTISGDFAEADTPANVQWHRQERSRGSFERTLLLGKDVDAEQVEAEYRNGILSVTLPKAASALPKKIMINVD